jgi:serine/threonine-protein kinase
MFPPGIVLVDRYRIIGLLGRGGMGEIYRADDLKLAQPVALKFLPSDLAGNAAWLARFHGEVRIARQVSHPNVCRVYDIGEVDGHTFLSMEYVDGEDLASLLRRIGRLPRDKGVEIARQLCAGLAAAHDRGVLHRDLKPANVMIDGRGKVRLTDFGIAGMAEELRGGDVRAGTPAYMAPEQIAGREVTTRSDIYSLGLVLYEIFTGKPAFEAGTLAELTRLQEESHPTSPSLLVEGIDPAVERTILRCLEKVPRDRPPSALAVAAGLPGGDPLAAALAAGETPSPEMVAAASKEGRVAQWVAWTLFALLIVAMAGVPFVQGPGLLVSKVPIEKSPEVLADYARNIIAKTGLALPAADSAFGYWNDLDSLKWLEKRDRSPARWDPLSAGRIGAITFWYR